MSAVDSDPDPFHETDPGSKIRGKFIFQNYNKIFPYLLKNSFPWSKIQLIAKKAEGSSIFVHISHCFPFGCLVFMDIIFE